MSLEREKQGLELKEYQDKLPQQTYAMRIGKEVPEGDVNLAYIHVPKVQSDENISLIDTSYTSDNVIPQEQIESMVVANAQGELEYADLIGNEEVKVRPPETTFPSDKINVTRIFKKNEMTTDNALYYKFEIDYHYDSKKAIPDEQGNYVSEKYTGQQIEITDENGNLLDDTYKYDIYVQPYEVNPRIYSVRIYLHKNSDKIETIKVRYNHVDRIVPDTQIQSVQKSIEFYSNKDNTFSVNGLTKQMLEGGKLRIINGVSAFEERPEAEVRAAMDGENDKEIFAVIPQSDGSGYKVIVPQKSENDPRVPKIFSHRVIAKYIGSDGEDVKVSVGQITDWAINSEALLKNELDDYSGTWKNIGIPSAVGKLNAKEMIELSLPFGTPSIPSDATYYVEDDKGSILYSLTDLTDNPDIDTQINEVMSKTVEAKANNSNQKPWINAMQNNTVIKSTPILHRATIIPERQTTKWEFAWKANGQGYTEQTTNYKTNWQVCANIGFKKSISPQVLDLLDKSKWATIGNNTDINNWKYSLVPEMSKNVIEYLNDADDVMGFYQTKEMINGSLTDVMNKTDYQFSVKVRLTDPVDDDAIGLMFRVRDPQNYYMFIWEKDSISTSSKKYDFDHGEGIVGTELGCDRVVLDKHGFTKINYNPSGNTTENWKWTNNRTKYLGAGLGSQHKRIMKVTPNNLPPFIGSDYKTWDGTTRYPEDKTGAQFTDITTKNSLYSSAVGKKGWEYNKDYKITVVITGALFRIYISENVDSNDLGTLVCQATDSTHQQGSYGIFCASQRWTYWYDLNMTEIKLDTVCTEKEDIVLTSTTKKKLSNYTAVDLLAPIIKKRAEEDFSGASYEIFGYSGKSDGDFTITIDPIDGFVYGKTNNPAAGGVVRSDWTTDDNGLSVEGKGYVEYHSDGHYTVVTDPTVLPTSQVPDGVKGFTWNQPRIVSGENVTIALENPDKIKVTATVPPIRVVGTPYVLKDNELLKADGIIHLEYLFGKDDEEGFYDKLEIPDNIPKDEILLRIERGEITAIRSDGTATVKNAEYRVNYRFRCQKDEFSRLPVDQFQDQLGVNRIRLKDIVDDKGEFDSNFTIDVVAWTTFQDLEAVPLFAIKLEEERKIEIEKPRIELNDMDVDNWYIRVKNGRFLKRIILPYFEVGSGEKLPEIYVAYPELLGKVENPDDIVEVDLEYYLPEYTNQEFHNRPYVLVDKEQPVILNEYAIQTRYAPLVLKSETGKSFLQVYTVRGNQRRDLRVSDVDAAKGIIYLLDRIREQDDIYVKYAYKEDWFTYRGFQDMTYKIIEKIVDKDKNFDVSYQFNLTAHIEGVLKNYVPYEYIKEIKVGDSTVQIFQYFNNNGLAPSVSYSLPNKWVQYSIGCLGQNIKDYRLISFSPELDHLDNSSVKMTRPSGYPSAINISTYSEVEGTFEVVIELTLDDGTISRITLNPMFATPVYGSFDLDKSHLHSSSIQDKTSNTEQTKTVQVEEIAIKDIAGEIPDELKESLMLNLDVDIFYETGITYKMVYKSDGRDIQSRYPTLDDIIVVSVTYTLPVYKEYDLTPDKMLTFFHLDLNPTPGHQYTIAKNGFHQWIPCDGNTEPYQEIDVPTTELLVKQIHIYIRPANIRDVNTREIIEGTMRYNTLYHTDEECWFNPKDYKYDPTMLRLGKVMLQANSTMSDNMTILDTRTRGGGLDEDLSKEIIRQVNKESLYHWDIGYFDGEAYQENGVMIIRLPREILKSDTNPNGFHETEVQEAVAKHKAFGLLPIIEYYDPVTDENKFNIIPNPEFDHGQHIGYFDPIRTKAPYEIIYSQVGAGDNYVLKLTDKGEYGITIPGHKFDTNQYRIDIKASKDASAPTRSAGTIDIFYKNGTTKNIQLEQINHDEWMVYKEFIDIDNDVHHVTITLNKTNETRTGSILYDYVMLHPNPSISDETTEIHEI